MTSEKLEIKEEAEKLDDMLLAEYVSKSCVKDYRKKERIVDPAQQS